MQKMIPRIVALLGLVCLLPFGASAQRVGVVLSGGGAKGLAHVGVLKVLEENGIPIDYIIGTSMGSIVGALYAAGYSPREMEQLMLTPEFQNWVSGKPTEDKTFNYLTAEPSPSALRVGVALDSTFKARISTNLVNDLNLNFALARTLAPAAAQANYDFDKLFVPFRCLAAEVFTRKQVIQKSGSLADAVRNSMTVPLAFRPIRNPDGRYLFDGGIYNNFPTDVMRKEFAPDVIIGVNVGDVAYKKYPFKNDDALLTGTLLFLGANVADTLSVGKNGVFIQPDLEGFGGTDFDRVHDLIAKGDTAAQRQLELLKKRITRRVDTLELQKRRQAFQAGAPEPNFVQVRVQGLRPDQNSYAQQFFRRSAGRNYTIDDLEEGYFRLASDDFFRNIYPRIKYDPAQKGYVMSVDARQNNNVTAEAGFVLSNRPLDNLYVGVEYRYLRRLLYSATANVSLGRFYNGAQGSFRINVPGRLPFYVEPTATYNRWDYQNTSGLLGRDVLSTQVRQQDTKVGAQVGISPNYRSRILLDVGAFYLSDDYANVSEISSTTKLDKTNFRGGTVAVQFARNSLNRKQYATSGKRAVFTVRGVSGSEDYKQGDTSILPGFSQNHQWVQVRGTLEKYFPLKGDKHAWGYYGEVVISGQGTFANYRSSITTAPVFAPLPDSRTSFMDNYRSPRYAAVGLRYTMPFLGKLEWRNEVFTHVNYKPLRQDENQRAVRLGSFERPRLTASTGLVFQTPVGPLALHALFYDDPARRFSVYGHLGYLLFRSRALE
ncbi:patatin-like phospholipase family protein [Hymenobacter sp. BT770]|uniref:patatin-like phospholipase family protein n=1 Tax=Hymenobacter sp. BT770 TaxID=2886942 RepID=UPI001D0FB510|nr:patatin-like phospholipase family protein [Hymenobacter sp. BT770]MCC3153753.1 patatin-like phospholipase family protein [Hymenobacter sp. BT770]MDO3416887.1 patatin-like phospholipase family protein [Hymenobacter sp. BT770]